MARFICIDDFARRQFQEDYAGTRITGCTPEELADRVNEYYEQNSVLHEGYAPFCKHIFMPNFTDTVVGELEITDQNRSLLKCDYRARRASELPVLERWFDKEDLPEGALPKAAFLDIILYSREQVIIENKAMGKESDMKEEWAIISVKAQNHDHESPMSPITMMRNALGAESGGSGVPLDDEKYRQSVAHWTSHAVVK